MTQRPTSPKLSSDQISRRGFLKASMSVAASPAMLSATAATTMVKQAAAAQQETGPERTLVGYGSRLSCRPGDRVEFKVSALKGGSYEADLVRIFNGDKLSRYKDRFDLRPVEAEFAGQYDGIPQPLNNGSYVEIANASALDSLNSFTVGAYIFPTFLPENYREENDVACITGNVIPRFQDPTPYPPLSGHTLHDVEKHPTDWYIAPKAG